MIGIAIAALLASQVTSASAKRDNAELQVRIDADGPIDATKVSARIESRRILLTLPATLDAANRTFHVAHRYLQARREGEGIELEVPIGPRVSCAGPVTVAAVQGGLEARVSCKEDEPAKTGNAAQQQAAPVEAHALPVETHALAVHAAEAPVAEAPVAEASAALVRPETRTPAAKVAEPSGPIFETSPPPAQVDLGEKKSSPVGAAAGALAVVALGAAAYFLRNQKKRKTLHIEVLETAALGPKRALVLARVGGKTLLLASSEAGISLLENLGEMAVPVEQDREPAPQPALLARLRKLSQPKLASDAPDPFARLGKYLKPVPPLQFDALFAEEQEDQELRMKLLAGQSARIQ
jgi:flagellar biogenesis protein FliO